MPTRKELELQIEIEKLNLKELRTRNEIFKPIRNYTGRNLILIGGSSSGKSYEIADMFIDRMVHETLETIGQAHRLLCVRNERKQVSLSQFPLLKARALLNYPDQEWQFNIAAGTEKITLGGNELLFAGLDDVEKLKSIFDITSIWVEEADQILEEDYWELERRLRGYKGYMQICLSFNPVIITSWINKVFFKDRTKRTINLCGRQPFENFKQKLKISDRKLNRIIKEEILVEIAGKNEKKIVENHYYHTVLVHSTYLDNKFLPDSEYIKMARLKEKRPEEFKVYGLGMWGIVGGGYFKNKNVTQRILEMTEFKVKRGEFKFKYVNHQIIDNTIEWVPDEDGYITIYENPKKDTPYVIGADTAGEGSDFNTGICTNNITEKDVASIRVQFDEDLHARQLYCLGKFYGELNHCANNALIGVELNFSTHPHKEIERMGYDNIYMRDPAQDSFSGEMVRKSGFKTTKSTRQHALDMLRTIVREEPDLIRDYTLLDEMLTFVKNEKGKPVAMVGKHDDMVMARAINCFIAHQQLESELETFEYIDMSNLPQDMIDDYLRAAENERHVILHNWRQEGVV